MRLHTSALLLALCLAPAACAEEQLVRSKANATTRFSGQIPVTLTIRPAVTETAGAKRADGKQGPPQQVRPAITRKQMVSYQVKIQGRAPLRLGETEVFRVTADHTHPQEQVRVRLVADRTVWNYEGAGEVLLPVELSTAAAGSPLQATFNLVPAKRRAITPPNLIGTIHVETGGPDDPVVLEFDDPGIVDDGGAKTSYAVEMKRSRTMWFGKSISRGELPAGPFVHQRLTLAKGDPLHVTPGEWLLKDYKYTVTVRVRKTSSDYTVDGSTPSTLEFKFVR